MTVRQWIGGSWVLLESQGMGDDYVYQVEVEVNSAGLPVVSMVDGMSMVLRVYEWDGSSWNDISPATIDNRDAFYVSDVDLGIASNYVPHVAVQDDWMTHAVSVFAHKENVGLVEPLNPASITIWPNPNSGRFSISTTLDQGSVIWRVLDASAHILILL